MAESTRDTAQRSSGDGDTGGRLPEWTRRPVSGGTSARPMRTLAIRAMGGEREKRSLTS
jgi:hypothetical protein